MSSATVNLPPYRPSASNLRESLPPMILVLGGPGSGKGTQSEFLSKEFGFPHLSAGDLLRKEVQQKTAIGICIEDLLMKGKLVPDETVLGVLCSVVRKLPEGTQGVLVDGFPRTLEQAELFQKVVGIPATILYFDVPPHAMRQRLALRGRFDDTPQAIERRIQLHQMAAPAVLEFFEHPHGNYASCPSIRFSGVTSSPKHLYHAVRSHFLKPLVRREQGSTSSLIPGPNNRWISSRKQQSRGSKFRFFDDKRSWAAGLGWKTSNGSIGSQSWANFLRPSRVMGFTRFFRSFI